MNRSKGIYSSYFEANTQISIFLLCILCESEDFTCVIICAQDFEAKKRINQPVALKVFPTLCVGLDVCYSDFYCWRYIFCTRIQ